jgi:hypothetical protein
VREEARSLMGGGILDERNDNKGFKNLPEPEVSTVLKFCAIQLINTIHLRPYSCSLI